MRKIRAPRSPVIAVFVLVIIILFACSETDNIKNDLRLTEVLLKFQCQVNDAFQVNFE